MPALIARSLGGSTWTSLVPKLHIPKRLRSVLDSHAMPWRFQNAATSSSAASGPCRERAMAARSSSVQDVDAGAPRLDLACELGKLFLVLRGPGTNGGEHRVDLLFGH